MLYNRFLSFFLSTVNTRATFRSHMTLKNVHTDCDLQRHTAIEVVSFVVRTMLSSYHFLHTDQFIKISWRNIDRYFLI